MTRNVSHGRPRASSGFFKSLSQGSDAQRLSRSTTVQMDVVKQIVFLHRDSLRRLVFAQNPAIGRVHTASCSLRASALNGTG